MKIVRMHCWVENLELTKPYTVAFETFDTVENLFLFVQTENGTYGLGAGSPSIHVTGETIEQSLAGLRALESKIVGTDVRHFQATIKACRPLLIKLPAALAAMDIALHDVFTKGLNISLIDWYGRVHLQLPTSVTIGIASLEETLEDGAQHKANGFKIIKLKTGREVEKDIEIYRKLKELVGPAVKIRVDANQGYQLYDLQKFIDATKDFEVEFIEQPIPPKRLEEMRSFPDDIRMQCAADEDLHDLDDAISLAARPLPYGIYNIKLMKCGGVAEGLSIAQVAERVGIDLMWGCMDESIISISAALHAAFASPATKYIDLDGSFDLAKDIVSGGFILENGIMRLTDAPGLGVTLLDSYKEKLLNL